MVFMEKWGWPAQSDHTHSEQDSSLDTAQPTANFVFIAEKYLPND